MAWGILSTLFSFAKLAAHSVDTQRWWYISLLPLVRLHGGTLVALPLFPAGLTET